MVCAGQLDISTAQEAVAKDWIAAYHKYYETKSFSGPPTTKYDGRPSPGEDRVCSGCGCRSRLQRAEWKLCWLEGTEQCVRETADDEVYARIVQFGQADKVRTWYWCHERRQLG
jgi:hypothetical protein